MGNTISITLFEFIINMLFRLSYGLIIFTIKLKKLKMKDWLKIAQLDPIGIQNIQFNNNIGKLKSALHKGLTQWQNLINLATHDYYIKKIIILITIIWLIFLLLGNITIPKLILFSKILLIIYIYKYLYANLAELVKEKTKINYVRKKWGWGEEKQWINIKKVKKINKILYILIKISTINNIILYLIPRIELKLYDYLESTKNNKINENFKQEDLKETLYKYNELYELSGWCIQYNILLKEHYAPLLYKKREELNSLNYIKLEFLNKCNKGEIFPFDEYANDIIELLRKIEQPINNRKELEISYTKNIKEEKNELIEKWEETKTELKTVNDIYERNNKRIKGVKNMIN